MSTFDLISEARVQYLRSPQTRQDWVAYLRTVETLRRQSDQDREARIYPDGGGS
jgi:hypothetical protein